MPRVSRARVIAADPGRVWDLISDPHSLPRWWPRISRVEDVTDASGAEPARWTAVLATDRGRGVRADFRRSAFDLGRRYAWHQEVEGTPFERILRHSALEIRLEPNDGSTRVELTSEEALRGLSRLGSPMLHGAARQRLDAALDGIERALVGEPESHE